MITFRVRSSAKAGEELPPLESELNYPLLLNRVLPAGVRVLGWAPVDDEFSARFVARSPFVAARSKQRLTRKALPCRFDCQYRAYKYFFMGDGMDIEAMQKASKSLIGENDYRNFCTMDVANVTHFNRAILEVPFTTWSHPRTSHDPPHVLVPLPCLSALY